MKEEFERLIYCATKAPSSHNAQPWKFRIKDDSIHIYPDYSRVLPVADADNHELFISLGCAVENLVIAANEFGYHSKIVLNSKHPVHIELHLNYTGATTGSLLYDQIEKRQSTRNKYDGKEIPPAHLNMLKAAAEVDGVRTIILSEKETASVIALVKEACNLQMCTPGYKEELVRWIRFNKFKATIKHDGIYSATTGNPDVPKWLGKLLVENAVSPEKEAKKCEELIRSSSNLVLFVAKEDNLKHWINTGRSFERFALTATALGIHNAHVNMPCEELSVRHKLSGVMALEKPEQPLLLVRIGYSELMPYSYRRPVNEVMVEEHIEMEIN